jgi:predicted MPP superfamily phosphohydrolase
VSRRGVALAAIVPLVLAIWGFGIEPAMLRVVERPVAVPGWAAGAPLRIALLADLHVGSPWNGPDRLREVVRRTGDAHPDLVLLLGDYVCRGTIGGRYVTPEIIEGIVHELKAPLGVYAVLGNHDLALNGRRITRALERAGIRVLSDRAVRLDPADGRHAAFWLAGVSDLQRGPHDVRGTLAQVTDDAPVLLMTHNPDLFPEVPAPVSLTVAGHTHGGQVRIPLVGRPIVPSIYGERYAAGLVVEGGRRLFVATGIGTSILPVRFLVPPEITVLVIERAPGQ